MNLSKTDQRLREKFFSGERFFETVEAWAIDSVAKLLKVLRSLFDFQTIGRIVLVFFAALLKWPFIVFRDRAAILTQSFEHITKIIKSNILTVIVIALFFGWSLGLPFLPVNLTYPLKESVISFLPDLLVGELVPLFLMLLLTIRFGISEGIALGLMRIQEQIPPISEFQEEDFVKHFFVRLSAFGFAFLFLTLVTIYVAFATHLVFKGAGPGLNPVTFLTAYLNLKTNVTFILQEASLFSVQLSFVKSVVFSVFIFFWAFCFALKNCGLAEISKNTSKSVILGILTCIGANFVVDNLIT